MITRSNLKSSGLALLFLSYALEVAALFLPDGQSEYIIPSYNIPEDNIITQMNYQLELSSAPMGIEAPYAQYNFIRTLSPAYLVKDERMREIIDTAILAVFPDVETLRQDFENQFRGERGMGDLRSAIIYLLKSPFLQNGSLEIPSQFWGSLDSMDYRLFRYAEDAISRMTEEEQEYIRNFDTLNVEPNIRDWPSFFDIHYAQEEAGALNILKEKEELAGLNGEKYLPEIERAVIASIAGFNYEDDDVGGDRPNLNSEEFTPQAKEAFRNRIRYWLQSQEFIPREDQERVFDKAWNLFEALELKKGLYPDSPWWGEIAEIYRILGGEIPTQIEQGRHTDYLDWGEDIYGRLWDISTFIPKVESDFGRLIVGPQMLLEQLQDKIARVGPAIVGMNFEGGRDFIRVVDISRDEKGGVVAYQDSEGNDHFLDLESEFLPYWDGLVYIPEEKSENARLIADFDYNPEKYNLIHAYGQWTINEFDELDAKIGINAKIPVTRSLPYYYAQFQVGGGDTFQYAGYFQTGIWLVFDDRIKEQLPRGTALVFDYYIPDYPKLKYLKVELNEVVEVEDELPRYEFRSKIAEFIIPADQLNSGAWNTFKIPIHYYLPGLLQLNIGLIAGYPDHYTPERQNMAVDRIYVE